MRLLPTILACLLALAVPGGAAADEVTLDKSVRISTRTADGKKLAGRVKVYDDEGFELTQGKDRTRTVKWDELSAKEIYRVKRKLIGWGNPQAYMKLGREMLEVEGGEEWAEQAFDSAVFLDPELKREARKALKEVADARAASEAEARAAAKAAKASKGGRRRRPAGAGRDARRDEDESPNAWPALDEDEQAEHVDKLKAFMDEAARAAGVTLTLHETDYFLFYSDLPASEAVRWSKLLDKMYARLSELFGVAEGENVWLGKAVVSVFSLPQDYARFQRAAYDFDPGASAGMCHCLDDGVVHATFYRPPSDLRFAHVLVHETTHGFLHRYRSPVWVPSWANEGLAEVVAAELVPDPVGARRVPDEARAWLNSSGPDVGLGALDEFFAAEQIPAEQYPVAQTLAAYMARRSKSGYIAFLDGIKDGLTWEQSLEQEYKTTRLRLVKGYLASLGVRNASDLLDREEADRADADGRPDRAEWDVEGGEDEPVEEADEPRDGERD